MAGAPSGAVASPDADAPATTRERCESRAARTAGRDAMDAEACEADSPSRGREPRWFGALARSLAPRIAAARGATATGRADASVDIETTCVCARGGLWRAAGPVGAQAEASRNRSCVIVG